MDAITRQIQSQANAESAEVSGIDGFEIDAGTVGRLGAPETDRARAAPAESDPMELRNTIQQLQSALQSRIVIEQAKGVLAERYRLSMDEAFALLRYSARATRRSVHALARAVVANGDTTPEALFAGLARPQRWRTPFVSADELVELEPGNPDRRLTFEDDDEGLARRV